MNGPSTSTGSTTPGRRLLALCLALICWTLVNGQAAQEPPPAQTQPQTPGAAAAGVEQIQSRIQEIEASKDIDETLKARLLDLYRGALTHLEAAKQSSAKEAEYRQAIDTAPSETRALRQQLESDAPVDPSLDEPLIPSLTMQELEQRLTRRKSEINDVRGELSRLETQLKGEVSRETAARTQINLLRQRLTEIDEEIKASIPANESPLQTIARRTSAAARRGATTAEISMLEQEILSRDARLDLARARRDLTNRRVTRLETRVRSLEEQINQRRVEEGSQERKKAQRTRQEVSQKFSVLADLAAENEALGERLAKVARLIQAIAPVREEIKARKTKIEDSYDSAREQLKIAGLTEALAQFFHDQRRGLPEVFAYRKQVSRRKSVIADVGLERFRTEERRRAQADLDELVASFLQRNIDAEVVGEERAEIAEQVQRLFREQLSLLEKLAENYGTHLKVLVELDLEQRQLIDLAESYAEFLDQHLLWIPSSSPIPPPRTGTDLIEATAWLLAPDSWRAVGRSFVQEFAVNPVPGALAILVALAIVAARRRLLRALEKMATKVPRVSTDRFLLTVNALLITLVLAAPAPLLLCWAGWAFSTSTLAPDFVKNLGDGLLSFAGLLFLFHSFLLLCRSKGVAEVHFRWRSATLAILRRHLIWFSALVLAAHFVIVLTEGENEWYRHSLGRLAFLVEMVALAVIVQRVVRPRGGIPEQVIQNHPGGWVSRLRYLWYPLAVGAPLLLAGLAATGYYYTSLQLERRLAGTVWLLVGAAILHSLATRWLMIAQRRLAVEQAIEKRKAAGAEQMQDALRSGEFAMQVELESPEIDISAIDEQSRKLLKTLTGLTLVVGFWFIWADVFPALNLLNQVAVWEQTLTVGDSTIEKAITLTHLTMALIIVVLTTAAAKNLPGVLEIAVLKNLPLEPGSRYAITSVCQYVIASIGIVVAFNAIGVGWSQVQWLVAFLSLGLGFGLQEIFANFVCGIILLFERPIRVGDVVTVGDTTGVVSKIRIRATTITNWDRKELVMPNKEFITGRVLNWTLSNAVNRIVINVGVAYGSDVDKARQLILGAASEHPAILKDPPPMVNLEEFAASSLTLVLRCFLPNLENRLLVINDLHSTIHNRLGEAGVEIAFPQQDIHLRSVEAPIRLEGTTSPREERLRSEVGFVDES